MANMQFYPLDIDHDEQGVIRLIGTTKDHKKICVYDDSFLPYFWIVGENVEKHKDDISKIKNDDESVYVVKVEVHDKNYLGKIVRALKVFYNNPKRINDILDKINDFELEKIEIDINFTKRYLVDKNITMMTLTNVDGELMQDDYFDHCIKGEVKQDSQEFYENPKVLVMDIEVYGSLGGTEKVKNDPILMIGLFGENLEKVITWKKFEAQDYVEFVNSEAEMIEKFKEIIQKYKPDIIVGYNSDSFDFPYIKERADKYGIKLNIGLDNSIIKFTGGMDPNLKIKGIIHLDLLKFIRKIMAANLQLDSYSLDSVAKELLQEGKKEIDVDDIMEAWDKVEDLEKFAEYNLKDVELTFRLFNKIFPIMSEIVKLTGMPMYDISRISYGQLVESYLIRRAFDLNEIVPNKPAHEDIGDRRIGTYKGAFVMEPKVGFYENVAFFDFRSLYPSIIVSKNIYPGNLNDKKEGYETPEIETEYGNKRYYFDTKKEGFIPQVVKDLIIRRNRVKEMMKNENNVTLKARSYALKTIANSTYGMYGFFGARYYSKNCAESITAFGRQYIQDTIKKCQEQGFLVIYSDSVDGKTKIMIKNNEKVYEEAIEKIFERTDTESFGKEYNFKEDIEILTIDKNGNSVFKPIKYIMRHKTNKRMFRVNFTNSWYIDVTEDHSLMGYQSSRFNSSKKNKENPLRRIIEVKPDEIKKKINTIISLKNIPILKHCNRGYPREVYEFMGYFIGDGSFMRNKSNQQYNKDYYLRLSLGLDKDEVFKRLIEPLINLGWIKSYWWSKTRKGDLTINGLNLVNVISNNFRDKFGKKIIPGWLFEEKNDNISAFLRGLFSADGCVMIRNNAPIIKYTSVEESYINMIRKLLYRVNVSHSVFKENSINKYKSKDKIYSSGTYSKNILIKDKLNFCKNIGFILERKNKRANILTKNLHKKSIKNYEFDLQSVKKVEQIKTPGYVYDIEVDENHKFFANYVLVHNTDSIAVALKDKTKKDASNFLDSINKELPSLMELELESFYSRGLFVSKKAESQGAKKKYALIDEKGKLKITGFETIRKDWSIIARETQLNVITKILKEGDYKSALDYVKDVIKNVKENKIELKKMVIKEQLKMPLESYRQIGPHVAVARRMKEIGMDVSPGANIYFIVSNESGIIRDKAKIPNECKAYDANYYIENQILPSVEKIFEVFGVKREDILIKEQSKLSEYYG